jgi:hypothetical protein
MVELICQRPECRRLYLRKPCLLKSSKFCSRRCHDLGKTYSDGRARGKRREARRLRRLHLTSSQIATTLQLSQRTVLVYIKGLPISQKHVNAFMREKHRDRVVTTNTAIKARLARQGVKKCQIRGCRWWRTLELHHEPDGTVKVLCPNHHSLTPNWKNRRPKVLRKKHVR